MTASFKHRSITKELLDGDNIPFADIRQNMMELNTINRFLGGHKTTVEGLRKIIKEKSKNELNVLEIGSGGGDNLVALNRWAKSAGLPLFLTGLDINDHCTAFAKNRTTGQGFSFITTDYRTFKPTTKPDVIFSSLFCHHFSNEDLVTQLRWMRANSKIGFFINDLHRHPIAYGSIKLLTTIFSRSYLVKNDAPLSVRRAFKRTDWQDLLRAAGICNYKIEWQWAFRWLITSTHEHST